MRKQKQIIRIRSNFGADTHSVADADTLPTMPRLVGEVMAVVQMAAAVVLGAWLGGAEATAAAAVGMATAGLGWTVVLGRRAAAGMRLVRAAVAEEDMGVEMAQDLEDPAGGGGGEGGGGGGGGDEAGPAPPDLGARGSGGGVQGGGQGGEGGEAKVVG